MRASESAYGRKRTPVVGVMRSILGARIEVSTPTS